MKIKDAIARLRRRVTADEIEDEELIGWLSDLDMMINREILLAHEGCGFSRFCGYDGDVDQDRHLLVPPPYTDIYLHWLQAKIAQAHREPDEYNDSLQQFNELRLGFADEINRRFMPKGSPLKIV